MSYGIERDITIDAAHRVPDHASKCRNLHGHCYKITAVCESSEVHQEGEQTGMVLDFGFLKDEMMTVIDQFADHGGIFHKDDFLVINQYLQSDLGIPMFDGSTDQGIAHGFYRKFNEERVKLKERIRDQIFDRGFFFKTFKLGKCLLIPYVPTAENLARFWFEQLSPVVLLRSGGIASLTRLIVQETPNCRAYWPK